MTGSRYRFLLRPLRLGPVVVRNRIVFCAHLTNYAEGGRPSAQHAAYYAARARGGAGLIITEEQSTHPTDWPYEKLIHGYDPAVVPGYRRITDAVHKQGTPIFAQLNHNGGQASGMYSRRPVWAPSAVPDPMFREVPKPVTSTEIREIIDGYATVAGHCRQGGFDGIELQCSHSSIVRGFLSGATNHRTDSYGGSLADRARFLLEVLAAVRAEIGPGMALGVRLCGDELMAGGITLDQTTEVAKMVEDSRHADYINTSIGVATSTLYMIEASMAVPPGYALFIPSAIRKTVQLPVVGVGRFKDPIQAERALAEGHADLIGVVRGQIADPDFAAKTRSGHAEDIRLCLSCNQECVGRMGLGRWLGCIENPRAGREAVPLPPPVQRPRRIMIAGGGPAGLQAAISAALRGHDVTVCECDDELGGQVRIAARAPGRAEFGDLVRNQLAECRRAGAALKTGVRVDIDLVRAERPDVVVVATGARPDRPYWATANLPAGAPEICDVRDVLDGSANPRGRVLVVDDLGFHQATSTAEVLADRGCEVELTTSGMVAGQDLGITLDMETWWLRATRRGIAQTTDTLITGVVSGGVTTRHLATGAAGQQRADWVVLAVQQAPADELYFGLKELRRAGDGPAVHRVGDCVAPRRAHAAVIDGERVGELL
ncbi:MAG TPA: mycofactocin system FadH/OYE family oxidoreductase 2 [Streptosporangiaceae bacterium]|nr:mycofactocin system FadH/OYE family oxidoreductase 2 [Streptosporangiaceae bacterium]